MTSWPLFFALDTFKKHSELYYITLWLKYTCNYYHYYYYIYNWNSQGDVGAYHTVFFSFFTLSSVCKFSTYVGHFHPICKKLVTTQMWFNHFNCACYVCIIIQESSLFLAGNYKCVWNIFAVQRRKCGLPFVGGESQIQLSAGGTYVQCT
jgi:hypothetical protein